MFPKKDKAGVAENNAKIDSELNKTYKAPPPISRERKAAGTICDFVGFIGGFVGAVGGSLAIISLTMNVTGLTLLWAILLFMAIGLLGTFLGQKLQYGTWIENLKLQGAMG